MSPNDTASMYIELRAVERVRHLSHQPSCCSNRQTGVRVQCYDVAHARRHLRHAVCARDKRSVCRAAQQSIELVKLAALALPSDPLVLTGVPHSVPMEEQKALARLRRTMALVQSRNARLCGRHQLVVARNMFGVRVRPIRKESEDKVVIGVGEEMHLEALDLFVDCCFRYQKRGHDDNRTQRSEER